MATLKLVLDKAHPHKDGSMTIRIAVCHKQETSYIATRFRLDGEKQWSNGSVIRRADSSTINMKLRGLLDRYQETLDDIPNQSLYNSKQLKDLIVSRCFGGKSKTFDAIALEYIRELKSDGRDSYATMIDLSRRHFNDFSDGEIYIADIAPSTINSFKRWLKDHTKANDNTIGKYLSHIKVVINNAIAKQYVSYNIHPFNNTTIRQSTAREADLSFETLIKIRDAKPEYKGQIVAQAAFMLSFYLGGINLKDLMSNKLRGLDELDYIRTKTKTRGKVRVVIPIIQEAKDIISKWSNKNTGRLDFGYEGKYTTFLRNLDRDLAKLKESLGIEEPLMFYSARKTFSQFAEDLGIPKSVIDYCIGHSTKGDVTGAFYTKVKKQKAVIAINRIADYLKNPDSYKEFIEMKREIMLTKM